MNLCEHSEHPVSARQIEWATKRGVRIGLEQAAEIADRGALQSFLGRATARLIARSIRSLVEQYPKEKCPR